MNVIHPVMHTSPTVPKGTNPTVNGQFDNGADVSNTVPNSVNPKTWNFESEEKEKIEKKKDYSAYRESSITFNMFLYENIIHNGEYYSATADSATAAESTTQDQFYDKRTLENNNSFSISNSIDVDDVDFMVELAREKFNDQTRSFSMTPREREKTWRFCVEEVFGKVGVEVRFLPLPQEGDEEYVDTTILCENSKYACVDSRKDDEPDSTWEKVEKPEKHSYLPFVEPVEPIVFPIKKLEVKKPPDKKKVVFAKEKPPTPAPWASTKDSQKKSVEVKALDDKDILTSNKTGEKMISESVRHPRVYILHLVNRRKFGVSFSSDGIRVTELDFTPNRYKIPKELAEIIAPKCGQRIPNKKGQMVNMSPNETVKEECAAGILNSTCVCKDISVFNETDLKQHIAGPTVNTENNEYYSRIAATVAKHIGIKTLSESRKITFSSVMEEQSQNSSMNDQVPGQTPEDKLRDSLTTLISIVCKKRDWLHNYSKEIRSDSFRGLFENWLTNASRDNGYHRGLHAVFSLAQQLFTISQDKRSQRHRDQELGLEEKNAIIHVLSKIPCPQDARRYLNKDGERHRKQGRGCSTNDCCYAHLDTLITEEDTMRVNRIGISVDGDRWLNYEGLEKKFGSLPSALNISSKYFPIKFRPPKISHSVHESLQRNLNSTNDQGPSKPTDERKLDFQVSEEVKNQIFSLCDPVGRKQRLIREILNHPQLSNIMGIFGDRDGNGDEDELEEVLDSFSDNKIHDLHFQLDIKEEQAKAKREEAAKADKMRAERAEVRAKHMEVRAERERLASMTPKQREAIAEEERKSYQKEMKAKKSAKKSAKSKFTKIWTGWR